MAEAVAAPPPAATAQHAGGTRSTLGPQGVRPSAPNYGFGSGTRETQSKVFISQEHAALAVNPLSPGPAMYSTVASVGPQVNSAMESAPRYGFGTSDRDDVAKVYISHEHEKTMPGGLFAPGPQYNFETGIGQQVTSQKATLPLYGFGSSTREHQQKVYISAEHEKVSGGPGEGAGFKYSLHPSLGSQVLSYGPTGYNCRVKNGSQPGWVMGKAERFGNLSSGGGSGALAPGPGTYTITPSVGVQVASSKPSLPRYGFGSSTREHANKVFISRDHAKLSGGKFAPGPGQYPVAPMTGAKVASSNGGATSSAWGFGTSKRFDDQGKYRAPGPGHYVI